LGRLNDFGPAGDIRRQWGKRVLERDGRYIDAEVNGVTTGPALMRPGNARNYDNQELFNFEAG